VPPRSSQPVPEDFLDLVETELLPLLLIRSLHPHDPVVVEQLPAPRRSLGSGNYAAVVNLPATASWW
jgi:hypothetical protein